MWARSECPIPHNWYINIPPSLSLFHTYTHILTRTCSIGGWWSCFIGVDWFRAKNEDRRTRRNKKYYGGKWSRLAFWAYSSQGWVLVFVIGLITGVIAAWVDNVSEWFFDIREGICQPWFWLSRRSCCPFSQHDDCSQWKKYSTIVSLNGYHYVADMFMYVAPGILMGVLSALFCQVMSKHAVGSGIPEIKVLLGGFQKKKILGGWALIVKAVGSVLSVGSGLSLGKEGPFVHMASCIGNIASRLFAKYKNNPGKRREVISSSCAAGVAVAFGAPIGGVLFAHEEASSYFPLKTMWRSFFCAIVAAIVLQSLNVQRIGKLVMFQVRYHHTWQWFEMPWFILLGIMGGIVGAIFIRLNGKWCEFRSRSKLGRFPLTEVFVVTLVSGVLNFVINSYLKMSATSLLSLLFDECDDPRMEFEGMKPQSLCNTSFESHVVLDLFITGLVKLVLTIFTFGISVPAGLFIPSLAIGAAWGRIAGIFVLHHFNHCTAGEPCVVTGAYALSKCVDHLQ
jgi:chloride channel 3/4/5